MKIKKDILVDFIRSETSKAGFSRGVIGLSGGVDSALVSFLAAEALGRSNLLALLMPYKTSNPESLTDAKMIAEMLGIRYEIAEITPMVDAYIDKIQDITPLRKGNVMARQRMIILYDYSARDEAIVIGTSNKTEILLGYGTLYGDTACGINPIGELYKTDVWALAEELGVPKKIIEKDPSADLWEGQTDEGELGFEYSRVDDLLRAMVDQKKGVEELCSQGFERGFVDKVNGMISRSEFKRRLPLIAKIGR